jgi:hypothetical protein
MPRGAARAVNPPSLSSYAKASGDKKLRRVDRAAFRGFAQSIGAKDAPAKIDEPAAHRTKDLQKSFCRMQPAAYGRAEIFHSSEPF